jgi:hypothetical protein
MTAAPDVAVWRVELESHGGREVVDIRYALWCPDGCWRTTDYGVSVPLAELLDGLEHAVGPQHLYLGDPAANFLAGCERAEHAARRLRRRKQQVTPHTILAELARMESRHGGR